MTGFGRADGALGGWTWAVEARSVNGRNLEVRFRGRRASTAWSGSARGGGQARFQRGQVTIGVQAKRAEARRRGPDQRRPCWSAIWQLRQPSGRGRARRPPSADGLLALRGVIEADEEATTPRPAPPSRPPWPPSIDAGAGRPEAVARARRARQLRPVLAGLVDRIEALVAAAEAEAAGQPAAIKDRFARRMAELAGEAPALEDRIVQEAAALAAKADVREELDRLAGPCRRGPRPAGRERAPPAAGWTS